MWPTSLASRCPTWAQTRGARRARACSHLCAAVSPLSAAMTMLKSLQLRHILHGVPLFFVCKLHAVGSVSELLV